MAVDRAPLLRLLQAYRRQYPDEATQVDRYLEFVQRQARCFERSLLEGHATGSAWLLDSTGERVLLTHHKKLNRWLQPGGHADGEPDLLKVAMREALEESGLRGIRCVAETLFDLDIHPIPARLNEPAHLHYDCRFLLQSKGPDEFTVSAESHDLAWVPIDSLGDYTDEESVLRMARKCQQQHWQRTLAKNTSKER